MQKVGKKGPSRLEKAEKKAIDGMTLGDKTITEMQEIRGKKRVMIVDPSAAQKYANKFSSAIKPAKDDGPKLHIKYSRIDNRKAAQMRKVHVPKDPLAEQLAKLKHQTKRMRRHSGAVRFVKAFDTETKTRRQICVGATEKVRDSSREFFDTHVKELADKAGKRMKMDCTDDLKSACIRSNSALTSMLYKEKHNPVMTLVKASSNRYLRPAKSGLRKSIVPGRVCILLTGAFKGRRVVVLKDKGSGDVLVTGPRLINGVPILRINQSFLIATSVKLPLAGIRIPTEVDSGIKVKSRKKLTSSQAIAGVTQKQLRVQNKRDKMRKAIRTRRPFQKFVDAQVVEMINKRADYKTVKLYLRSKFGLKGHERFFHTIKFL